MGPVRISPGPTGPDFRGLVRDRQELVSVSSHEFVQSPLYSRGGVTRKSQRVISAEPFFHSARHKSLFANPEKLALLR